MERYERNRNSITPAQQALLADKSVLVAGCGGLGGYVLEYLGRLGVGHLTAVDGDVFVPSNLNRQILCTQATLGRSKAAAAAARMGEVNPLVTVTPVQDYLTAQNAADLTAGHDLVVDALDSPGARLLLWQGARAAGIPMVHGAIAGWWLRVAAVFPEDTVLPALWAAEGAQGAEAGTGNLSFTAACAAAYEAAEAVKLLLGQGSPLRGAFLEVDLLRGTAERVALA